MLKRIVHITDTHLGEQTVLDRNINPRKNLTTILETIAGEAIDELVFTGDIGEVEEYGWFFQHLEEYKPGFKITLGNHDNYKEATNLVKDFKTEGESELYYTNEDEYYKYIFLDSSSATVSPAQLTWLSAQITTPKKIVIFIHHPILGFATGVDISYPLHNRDEVAQILQQSKQEVNVFCGHYHMPDKRRQGRITQYITPAVSFQVKKFSPNLEIKADTFGYRIITLTDLAIKSMLVVRSYTK